MEGRGIPLGEGGEWFGSRTQRLGTEKLGQEEGTGSAESQDRGFALCVPARTPTKITRFSPSQPCPGDDPRVKPAPRPSLNPSADLYGVPRAESPQS